MLSNWEQEEPKKEHADICDSSKLSEQVQPPEYLPGMIGLPVTQANLESVKNIAARIRSSGRVSSSVSVAEAPDVEVFSTYLAPMTESQEMQLLFIFEIVGKKDKKKFF